MASTVSCSIAPVSTSAPDIRIRHGDTLAASIEGLSDLVVRASSGISTVTTHWRLRRASSTSRQQAYLQLAESATRARPAFLLEHHLDLRGKLAETALSQALRLLEHGALLGIRRVIDRLVRGA